MNSLLSFFHCVRHGLLSIFPICDPILPLSSFSVPFLYLLLLGLPTFFLPLSIVFVRRCNDWPWGLPLPPPLLLLPRFSLLIPPGDVQKEKALRHHSSMYSTLSFVLFALSGRRHHRCPCKSPWGNEAEQWEKRRKEKRKR